MTLQHFARHACALWIPDAWTRWTLGTIDYQRFDDGSIGWRPTELGARSAWQIGDVAPVVIDLTPRRRKAVA